MPQVQCRVPVPPSPTFVLWGVLGFDHGKGGGLGSGLKRPPANDFFPPLGLKTTPSVVQYPQNNVQSSHHKMYVQYALFGHGGAWAFEQSFPLHQNTSSARVLSPCCMSAVLPLALHITISAAPVQIWCDPIPNCPSCSVACIAAESGPPKEGPAARSQCRCALPNWAMGHSSPGGIQQSG